jgi:hypothetical protein
LNTYYAVLLFVGRILRLEVALRLPFEVALVAPLAPPSISGSFLPCTEDVGGGGSTGSFSVTDFFLSADLLMSVSSNRMKEYK